MGYDGVDKRLDVIATAISAGMKAAELKNLDLAYAPPYSSAKDPVNMAGFMIENIESGIVKQFHFDELDKLPRDGSVTLLDTRTQGEYAKGHVDGFINIPVDDLRESLENMDKSKPVYVMCQAMKLFILTVNIWHFTLFCHAQIFPGQLLNIAVIHQLFIFCLQSLIMGLHFIQALLCLGNILCQIVFQHLLFSQMPAGYDHNNDNGNAEPLNLPGSLPFPWVSAAAEAFASLYIFLLLFYFCHKFSLSIIIISRPDTPQASLH